MGKHPVWQGDLEVAFFSKQSLLNEFIMFAVEPAGGLLGSWDALKARYDTWCPEAKVLAPLYPLCWELDLEPGKYLITELYSQPLGSFSGKKKKQPNKQNKTKQKATMPFLAPLLHRLFWPNCKFSKSDFFLCCFLQAWCAEINVAQLEHRTAQMFPL